MKKFLWLPTIVAAMWLGACGPSNRESQAEREAWVQDSIKKAGPLRMQVSEVTSKVMLGGREFESMVVRKPDDLLPVVTNEQGDKFIDNRITLKLISDGKTILDRVFTKESFTALVDAKFLKYAILEGLVLDEVAEQGIVYAVSVAYPQTDLYVPLRITVGADGKVSMSKEDLMDDWHEADRL